jgi:hypothetical protein
MCIGVPGAVLKLLTNEGEFSVNLSGFFDYNLGDRKGLLSDFVY